MRILFLLISSAVIAAAQSNPAIDHIFERFDHNDSPGCSLAVTQAGKVLYAKGYGMADLDHDIPITPASVFHVASISKEFTAASILLLEEEGKLSIDDEVRKYIPELPDFGTKVTLRHLLHHSSGIRDQWSLLELAGWRLNLDLITDQDVLDILSRQKALNFKPGDEYLYSNSGFTLLAIVVQRVSGKTLREFTQERIFGPLGMTHTFFRNNHGEIVKQQAYGYVRSGQTWNYRVPQFDTTGATSLLTTAEDFAKWTENFDNPRVLPKVISKMQERGRFNNGKPMDYAFGLAPGTYRGLEITGHGGADAGYRADFLRFPTEQLSVACLCNLSNVAPRDFTKKVAELYLGTKMSPEPPALKAPQVSDANLGLYYNAALGEIRRLARHDGKIMLYSPGPRWEELNAFPLTIDAGRIAEARPSAAPAIFERRPEWTPADLYPFAGRYYSPELDVTWEIAVKDQVLSLKQRKFAPASLSPAFQDAFVARTSTGESLFEFQRGAGGRLTGFALSAGRIRHLSFTKE